VGAAATTGATFFGSVAGLGQTKAAHQASAMNFWWVKARERWSSSHCAFLPATSPRLASGAASSAATAFATSADSASDGFVQRASSPRWPSAAALFFFLRRLAVFLSSPSIG